tara:strand:+ start:6863 stop:7156 length:294 start_codon:yes stop_codon:yes gene_type:complete
MKLVIDAILALNSKAVVNVQDNDVDKIEWLEGTTPISKTEINSKLKELEDVYNANEYQRKRAIDYPSIADQLDDLYHNGIDGWKKTIKAVKDKYPKE